MARHVLDFDPTTGVTTYFDYSDNGEGETGRIVTHQDTTAILEACQKARNDEDKTARGIKNDNWKYAMIPVSVQMEMLSKYGVDFHDQAQRKEVFHLINTVYKQYKTTNKMHMASPGTQYYISSIKPAE
jgi:hypothetical protein